MIDNLCMRLAFLLPKRLVKWAAIRVFIHASEHYFNQEFDTLTPADCLKAWNIQ